MNGETSLNKLIKNVHPELNEGKYVFVTIKSEQHVSLEGVVCSFQEEEGLTLVLKKEKADELELEYSYIAAWITLKVHSSLETVGLTAKVATALSSENISCNAIAAFNHDHIFVPHRKASRAMAALRNIS